MIEENWRLVPGYEDHYEVSDLGQIWSQPRVITGSNGVAVFHDGRMLRSSSLPKGYLRVTLTVNRIKRDFYVHTLVLTAFVGPAPLGHEARHFDGDPTNNKLDNLAWGTPRENAADQIRHGRCHRRNIAQATTHCPRNHPLAAPNLVASAWRDGARECRACARATSKVHYARKVKGIVLDRQEVADAAYVAIMAGAS